VIDARTEITTQLLSDEGYAVVVATDEGEGDNNNLIGKKDGKELLDQAAVMEMFARLAAISNDKNR